MESGVSVGGSHCLASHGGSKQPLASLVQLGQDDVLGLVGRGLC